MASTSASFIFPQVFSIDSKGKSRCWFISVTDNKNETATIRTVHGLVDGKMIESNTVINYTKSKATPFEQAKMEAQTKWNNKHKKDGYVEDITLTQGTMHEQLSSHDDFLFSPMLALKLEPTTKLTFPRYIQPKLDGIRYTIRCKPLEETPKGITGNDGCEVIIRSRNNTDAPFFHHIRDAISKIAYLLGNVCLDGEMYSPELTFNEISGTCASKKISPEISLRSLKLKYYIFDCYFPDKQSMDFKDRYAFLKQLSLQDPLLLVDCLIVNSRDEITARHKHYVEDGYEGIMIRSLTGAYKLGSRSSNLLKYKDFTDEEFKIIGATCSPNGREEGCIIFTLETPEGKTFECRPTGTCESRKVEYIKFKTQPSNYIGKLYTVKYQEKTPDGIPRFPSGSGIRF